MARPTPQPALSKAPSREHPVAPAVSPLTQPPEAPAVSPPAERLEMFSARINRSLRRRVKRYSADSDQSLQEIAEAALSEYLDRRGA